MRDWGGGRALRRVVLLGLTLAVLVAGGAAGATLQPKLLTKAGYGTVPIGFARSADGSLHVAYETNTSWGDSASGVAAVSISPSGHIGPQVQALSWTGRHPALPAGFPGSRSCPRVRCKRCSAALRPAWTVRGVSRRPTVARRGRHRRTSGAA